MDVLKIEISDQVFGVLRHFTYSFMIARILKDKHLVKRDIQSLYLFVSFAIVSLRERESWLFIFLYIKTCLKRPLKKNTLIGFQYRLSLNAGRKYCRMLQGEHSAYL